MLSARYNLRDINIFDHSQGGGGVLGVAKARIVGKKRTCSILYNIQSVLTLAFLPTTMASTCTEVCRKPRNTHIKY